MFRRTRTLAVVLGTAVMLVGACGGGGDDDNVATLSDEDTDSSGEQAASDEDAPSDEEVLDYVECLRDQGLDVPDPTVDEDGNLVLGRPGGVGGGNGSSDDDSAEPGTPSFDREDFEAAIEECGEPPRQGGEFSPEEQQERQDEALAFAQCMRDQGIDFPDPDFSGSGPGGSPGSDEEVDTPLFDIDMDDPEVQAAFEACQDEGFGPRRGNQPPGEGDSSEGDD